MALGFSIPGMMEETLGESSAPSTTLAPISYENLPYRGNPYSFTPDTSALSTSLGKNTTSASKTYAQLTRQQWADYVKRFVPYENALISYAMSPSVVTDNMALASQYVKQAFAQQPGMLQRQLAGYGIQQTAEQQASNARQLNLAEGLADVHAQNLARDATLDRQMSVVTGQQIPNTTTPPGV